MAFEAHKSLLYALDQYLGAVEMGIQKLKEEQEYEENIVKMSEHKLKLITGGKDGTTEDKNWLKDLEVGTMFLARHKSTKFDNPVVERFDIQGFSDSKEHANLIANPHMQPTEIYVGTLRFSRQYEFCELLGKVVDNGGDGTLQPSRVVRDEDITPVD